MNPERFEKSGTLVCKRHGRTLVDSWNPKSRLAARYQAGTELPTAMRNALRVEFAPPQAAPAFRAVRENEPRMAADETPLRLHIEILILITFSGPPGGSVPAAFPERRQPRAKDNPVIR